MENKYTTYIYDIEVFVEDWIVVIRNADIETPNYLVLHNNNAQLKEFIYQPKDMIMGGFNNKGYDDWIILSMLNGADNAIVKKHNDHIIGGGNGWEFPFIAYKKKPFKSFDLRDDLPRGLSLKAIEGNMLENIVESKIDFNINRKLTKEELEIVIAYCKRDVDASYNLYKKRSKYIQSKKDIAKIKGVSELEVLPLTNAKITSFVLDAKYKDYGDEFEYTPPDCLKLTKYPHIIDFFKNPIEYTSNELKSLIEAEMAKDKPRKIKIKSLNNKIEKLKTSNRYKCKLATEISGVPHVYGWGGIHGAIKNFFYKETEGYKIVDIDVGSYYPSQMLVFNYISRSVPSAELYANIYKTRLQAKHDGDKATANALKLVLNTCYGAMKNRYNDLYDPKNASAICITGMLLLTDLLEKLEDVEGTELIQSNTDGIIVKYPISSESKLEATVTEWEERTGLNMEYTVIKDVAQKDVNNYIMRVGETYLIKKQEDGTYQKVVTDEDKNSIKTKGGYVSLSNGGDFVNNSLVIVHKAIVNYFMDNKPVEDTINEATDITEFQIIAKTGSTYDGTYWENNGEKIEVQRVNRVYASKNSNHGTLYKVKGNKVDVLTSDMIDDEDDTDDITRTDKIASLPIHSVIDNEGLLKLEDIDRTFYIELAKSRVSDYLGKNKNKSKVKEDKKMATKKEVETTGVDMKNANLYQRLAEARIQFMKAGVKKTGINRNDEYKYFQLEDIVPVATEILTNLDLIFITTFTNNVPTGILYDMRDDSKNIVFNSYTDDEPLITRKGNRIMTPIQEKGAKETYQRRYLYVQLLDITEGDIIDSGLEDDEKEDSKSSTKTTLTKSTTKKTSTKPATNEEREELKKELTDVDGKMSETQEKSIKNGLKKLRDKDADKYEDYIKGVVKLMKSGIMTKKDAEDTLIEIGNKIEEK